ncbi:MAG: bifunctional glutamate N-acetyltransferase/amino-acid acetyltransferase ArgJ [Micrococcales bacterium]|nr:bifunctional glutamate N-acetyltransferase/amino-acid acetyltransferase ArgJ [Micrococcales bacterium]
MSVTFAKGFKATGLAAGLKPSGSKDLALVVADPVPGQARAAAVFTTNRFAAAPVELCRRHLAQAAKGGPTPVAVVLNSGGANACTGQPGLADAETTASQAAAALGLSPAKVLVASTGLIGQRLDMASLLRGLSAGIGQLDDSAEAGLAAAEAIMTTDTVPKQAQCEHDGWRIGGMAKGAGMLAPELATMLVVITTDAVIDQATAKQALKQACRYSFDRTDSDGCMSTNDVVFLLSSGRSGLAANTEKFTAGLTKVCQDLALQLVDDAEGADHVIEIVVEQATSETGALAVARAVARSNLFKTAIAGRDPNWGRILSAAGTVSPEVAPFDPAQVDVAVNGIWVCRGGGVGDSRELVDLSGRQVKVEIDLKAGQEAATVLTNDLTHEYIHINADYST